MAKQKKPAHEAGEPSPVNMGTEPPSQAATAAAEAQPSQLHVAAEDTPRPASAVSLVNTPAADADPSEDAPAVTETEAAVLASAAAQTREAEAEAAAGAEVAAEVAAELAEMLFLSGDEVAAEMAEELADAEAEEEEGGIREEAAAEAEPSKPAGCSPRGRDRSPRAAPAATTQRRPQQALEPDAIEGEVEGTIEASPQLLSPERRTGLESPLQSLDLDALRTPTTAERWPAQAEPRGSGPRGSGPRGSSAAPTTRASHGAPATRARAILSALDVVGAGLEPLGWAGPSVSPSPRASTARASEGVARSPSLRSPSLRSPSLRSPSLRSPRSEIGARSPRSAGTGAGTGARPGRAECGVGVSQGSLGASASPASARSASASPRSASGSASASALPSASASASESVSASASASASRLATPERRGGTQLYGERYSASLAAASLSGPASPAAARHRWAVAREGEPTARRTLRLTLALALMPTPTLTLTLTLMPTPTLTPTLTPTPILTLTLTLTPTLTPTLTR